MVDKRIILELLYNGRLAYRTLAHHLGLTIKSVRKRVTKLIEKRIIKRFVMALNRTALGSDTEVNLVLGQLWTNGTEHDDILIQQIGHHNSVYRVFKTTRDNYGFYALVIGFQGLSDLTEFIQGLTTVTKVETDTLIFTQSPGLWPKITKWHIPKVRNLTKDQWQVVRSLKDDPRMPIAEVARRTGQPVRQVRKTINLLIETRYVIPTIRWDPAAAGHVQAFLRTDLNLNQITREDFANWLYEKYPCEC
jgi:DNA-binding Lrp family transcriptional regulator